LEDLVWCPMAIIESSGPLRLWDINIVTGKLSAVLSRVSTYLIQDTTVIEFAKRVGAPD
jgi:hypothetical protein